MKGPQQVLPDGSQVIDGILENIMIDLPVNAHSLRTALSAMPIGVSWATLADQKIVFMNRKFTEIFGYEVDDFTDIANWIETTYPCEEDRVLASKKWGAYFAAPDGHEFAIEPMELRVRCRDGKVKTILHSGVILPETNWALATFVDITDRKRDELLFKNAARQARENQAIYRLLLDHSPEMIVLSPFDDSPCYVSNAVERTTGFSSEEYLAFRELDFMHPLDRAEAAKVIREVKCGNLFQVLRYRTLQKNGQYLWVEASVAGYVDPASQRPAGYVATVRNIAVQRDREEEWASKYLHMSAVAAIDELTGIANRRTFNQTLQAEASRQSRSVHDLSLLMLDIDYFKQYNDVYGHLIGDACLKKIADTIKHSVRRDADLLARFGGEEFVLLMPSTDSLGAEFIAGKILKAVSDLSIPHSGCTRGIVTISIGIVSWPAGVRFEQSDLLEQADRALYQAKRKGRNAYHSASVV